LLTGPLANLAAAAVCGLALSGLAADSPFQAVLLIVGSFQALSALINLAPVASCDGARIFR
jgi:Zn-dependent protease